mgnify:CR=1 FL=1
MTADVGPPSLTSAILRLTDGRLALSVELARFGLESTVRPSFAFYNTQAEADALVDTLRRINLRR